MIDPATRFATSLAEKISPDEVDVAPALLASVRRGGEDWRRIKASGGGVVVGGISGLFETLGILHLNFESLKFCVEAAVVGVHMTELRPWIREHIAGKLASGESTQSAGGVADQFIEDLVTRLEAKGLARIEARRNAGVVSALLAENPEAGARFLEALVHPA